jgi:anaerobic magnesium-protoporphyrin IX monomethyl ester cyclase
MSIRTLLINPTSEHTVHNYIPLGLSYLGAVLKENGFTVQGIDTGVDKIDEAIYKDFDLFGFYVPTIMVRDATEIAKRIKEINPNAFVVFGGPHPTALPEEVLKLDSVDAVCIGEGEYTLSDLVNALSKGGDLKKVNGMVFKKDGRIIHNQPRETLKDLDELPFPAKDIFDDKKYPSRSFAYSLIIASRGCPFNCANCMPGLRRIAPYRIRKPEKVIDEMEYLKKKYKVTHFSFSDSELIGPKQWVIRFCEEIEKRGLSITFSCNGRTDQIDTEILTKLKKAGCTSIGYGIESGSQRVLDNILRKGISLDQSKNIVEKTQEIGIDAHAWFMVGIPGEVYEECLKTIEYATKLDATDIEVNIATPWPDTDFYFTCKKNGWLTSEDWSEYNEKSKAMINTPYLSREQVMEVYSLFRKEIQKEGIMVDGVLWHKPSSLRKIFSIGTNKLRVNDISKKDIQLLYNYLKVYTTYNTKRLMKKIKIR